MAMNWLEQMFTPQRPGPGQMAWRDIVNEDSGEFSTGDMQEMYWKRNPLAKTGNRGQQMTSAIEPNPQGMGVDPLSQMTRDMEDELGIGGGGAGSALPTSIAAAVVPPDPMGGSGGIGDYRISGGPSFAQTNTITEGPRSNFIPPEGMGGEFPSVFEGQGTNLDFNPEAGGISFNPIKSSGSIMDSRIAYDQSAPQNDPDAARIRREAFEGSQGMPMGQGMDMGGQQTQPTAIAQLMKLLGSGAGDMFSKMFSPSQAGAGMPGPQGPGARFSEGIGYAPGTVSGLNNMPMGSRRMY